jgi:hypothetical protein
MMNKKNLPHIITVTSFVVFIVLGLACATTPNQWKDVTLNGEDSKVLEGTAYVFTVSDWSPGRSPLIISFLSNGKADGFNGKSSWERTESDVRLVIENGRSLIEGVHNPENKTISGTISRTDGSKSEIRMEFFGAAGTTLDTDETNFSVSSAGFMVKVGDSFYTIAAVVGYNGNNTKIRVPSAVRNGLMVTDIGRRAFYNKNLTYVILPRSLIPEQGISIGEQAFANNPLTSITIPDSITYIGQNAFNDCTSLTSVTFQGKIPSADFSSNTPFLGDLRAKYLAEGIGTYTTTAPVSSSSVWTKQ